MPHIHRSTLIALVLILLLIGCTLFIVRHALFASRTTIKYSVLFDNAHDETAGNADWIISTSIPDPLKENAHPQVETDWTGGISSWGVALQKTGRYQLMTTIAPLSYGDKSNPLDLSRFNVLIVPEPNMLLTYSERVAVVRFVHNGGGLFMIADHHGSDRDNDGYDSIDVFNDLMNDNTFGRDVFGIQFDVQNIYYDNPHNDTPHADPLLQGPFGKARGSIIRSGTTETIYPQDNPNVRGVIYTTGVSNTGTTGVFVARSQYGKGRVIAVGDSSAIDDGTCEADKHCDDGWEDQAGQNAVLFPNGTEWLAGGI